MFRMLFLIWFYIHPVHLSITSIDYVQENNYFKGFVRIFMDDYLSDCRLHGYTVSQEELLLKTPEAIRTLEKYLNEKLIVKVNNEIVGCSLDNVNISDNEMDINLKFGKSVFPESISIVNRIMTDLYEDQSNMMIIKVDDFEEGVKLTSADIEKTFVLN